MKDLKDKAIGLIQEALEHYKNNPTFDESYIFFGKVAMAYRLDIITEEEYSFYLNLLRELAI